MKKLLLVILFFTGVQYISAQPKVQRIQGQGNGGLILDMTQQSTDQALLKSNNYKVNNPVYEPGKGPISVEIIDSSKACDHDFEVYLRDTTGSFSQDTFPNSKWYIKELSSGDIDSSDNTIICGGNSEKNFPQWGIKIKMQQVTAPGMQGSVNNGLLESTMEFSDTSKQWLSGFADIDRSVNNWILSGTDTCVACGPLPVDYYPFEDSGEVYEHVLNGTWSPFRLASYTSTGPVYDLTVHNISKLSTIESIDLVLTKDTSKWSRSIVIEEQSDVSKSQANARKGDPRSHASVDKRGKTSNGSVSGDPNDPNYISESSMSWFPGYAIDIETGERLNIMFGENSYFGADSGRDMKFNPTSTDTTPSGDIVLGGMHYIYIMGRTLPTGTNQDSNYITVGYDACNLLSYRLMTSLTTNSSVMKRFTYRDCMWVNLPKLVPGHSLLESDVKIRLRVAKPYRNYNVGGTYSPLDAGIGKPYYKFSVNCTMGVEEHAGKTKNILQSVYPNPFSNQVYITVNMPERDHATIKVYNMLGNEVATLADKDLPRGMHTFYWDGKNKEGVVLANGLYMVRMQISNESAALPILFLH